MRPSPSVVPAGWGPLERAARAWREGRRDAVVDVRTDLGPGADSPGEPEHADHDDPAVAPVDDEADTLPMAVLFRGADELHPVEVAAVEAAVGSVLDVGAGAGAVAVALAARGHPVTAVEPVPALAEALRSRGVEDVRVGALADLAGADRYDTVVSLMNGAGLAGTLAGLAPFLAALGARTAPGGRILLDSTDPAEWPDPGDGRRPGEVHLQLGFDGEWGEPIPWLYVGPEDLLAAAVSLGMAGRVVLRTDDDRFLVALRVDGG